MIYHLAVTLTDIKYKCEFCVLSPGQDMSDKFMEIDLAISTQKSLGNSDNLNDSTTDNTVDQPPPANNAPISTNGDTGRPSETDVDQQDANPGPIVLLRLSNSRMFPSKRLFTNLKRHSNMA